jgi:2-hydroxycyclohexanecarboxyl-CoA dehydrogenase
MTHNGNILNLDGRTVMITGAGQGIGRQVALQCAANGGRVIVDDFHHDRAHAVTEELHALGAEATAASYDVSDFDEVLAYRRQRRGDLRSDRRTR